MWKLINYLYLLKEKFSRIVLNLLQFFYIKVYLVAILFLNAINWLAVYFINRRVSQDLVALHYNIDFGVNLIGSVKRIYLIPFLGLIIALLNLILTNSLYRQDRFAVHLLLAAALLANLFLLTATASLYLINFR